MAPGGTLFRFPPHFGENVLPHGSHEWLPYSKDEVRLKSVNNNLPEQYRSRGPKDVRWLPRVCNALAAGPAGKQQFASRSFSHNARRNPL